MIKREHYIEKIRDFYDSDLIKIITGIRRSGKSVILEQIAEEISLKSQNIIYLNFEDKRISANIRSALDLIQYVENNRKDGKCYLFFDEIQNLSGWQDACKTLRLYNNSLFITGSNSKLLSGEFTKELSGRFVSFRIRPFVYKEIVEYSGIIGKETTVMDYLVWGGFPKRFEMNTHEAQKIYLNDLDATIVTNDLLHRYKIRKVALFESLVNFILRSNSRIFSVKSITDHINRENQPCSVNTIIKYMDYLKEAYIIDTVKQYSTKTKKELSFYEKLYIADVALNSIRCPDNRFDISHNLENIVYNELVYMGYSVSIYIVGGKEVDFLAQKDGKSFFIQVALSVMEEKAYNREIAPFALLDNIHPKILITNDELDFSTGTIKHIKLKDFLQADSLLSLLK